MFKSIIRNWEILESGMFSLTNIIFHVLVQILILTAIKLSPTYWFDFR